MKARGKWIDMDRYMSSEQHKAESESFGRIQELPSANGYGLVALNTYTCTINNKPGRDRLYPQQTGWIRLQWKRMYRTIRATICYADLPGVRNRGGNGVRDF